MLAAETFEPFDAEQGRRQHEALAELPVTCPVARLGSGMLVVSRYDDVRPMLTARACRTRMPPAPAVAGLADGGR